MSDTRIPEGAPPPPLPASGSTADVKKALKRTKLTTADPSGLAGADKPSLWTRFRKGITPGSRGATVVLPGMAATEDKLRPAKATEADILPQAGDLLVPRADIDAAELHRQRSELAQSAHALVDVLTGAQRPQRDLAGPAKAAATTVLQWAGLLTGLGRGAPPSRAALADKILPRLEKTRPAVDGAPPEPPAPVDDRLTLALRVSGMLTQLKNRDDLLRLLQGPGAAAPDGTPLSASIDRANQFVAAECDRWADAFVQQQIVGDAKGELADRLKAAAAQARQRLSTGQPALDAGAMETLVFAGLRGTRAGSAERARALESLLGTDAASLVRATAESLIHAGGAEGAAPAADGHADLFRITDNLIRSDGGIALVQSLTATPAAQKEALRVALLAGHAQREAAAAGTSTPGQVAWLQRAVAQAEVRLGVRDESADTDAVKRQRQAAFNGVGMGYFSTEPGSPYAQVNAVLRAGRFEGPGGFDVVSARNQRAGTVLGDLRNKLGTFTPPWPRHLVRQIVPNMPWRRSAVRRLVRELQDTHKLPSADTARRSLHNTCADVREALQAHADAGQASAAERLMLGVLTASGLGAPASTPGQPRSLSPAPDARTLDKLAPDFFRRAELPAEDMKALPKELQDEWRALSASRPNIGHVLSLLRDHVNVQAALLGDDPQPPELEQDRLAREATATQMVKDHALLGQEFRTLVRDQDLGPQAEAVADLLQAAAAAYGNVKPAANLFSLAVDHHELVDGKVAELYKARHSADADVARMTGPELLEAAQQHWPKGLRDEWKRIKTQDVDAGTVLSTLARAAAERVGAGPDASAKGKATADVRTPFQDALDRASGVADRMERQSRAERFRSAASDVVALSGDVRHARHAVDVWHSMSRKLNLGDLHELRHGRYAKVSPLAGVLGLVAEGVLPVTPIATRTSNHNSGLSIASPGPGNEAALFAGWQHSGEYGAGVGFSPMDLPHDEPAPGAEREADRNFDFRAGARATWGEEVSRHGGALFRVPRSPERDREMNALMVEALHRAYRAPDPMAELMLHPEVVVSPVEAKGLAGGASHGVEGGIKVNTGVSNDPDEREQQQKRAMFSAHAGARFKGRKETWKREEEGNLGASVVQAVVTNSKDVGASAEARLQVSGLPPEHQDTAARLNFPMVALGAWAGYPDISQATMRLSSVKGEPAASSQVVMTYNDVEAMLRDLQVFQPAIVKRMIDEDPYKCDPDDVKARRAVDRFAALVAQYRRDDSPNTTYVIMSNVSPDAARRLAQLRAIAESLAKEGRHDEALRYRQSAVETLGSEGIWVGMNAREQVRGRSAGAQDAGVLLAAAGEKTLAFGTSMQAAGPSSGKLGKRPGETDVMEPRPGLSYRRGGAAPAAAQGPQQGDSQSLQGLLERLGVGMPKPELAALRGFLAQPASMVPQPGPQPRRAESSHAAAAAPTDGAAAHGAPILATLNELREAAKPQPAASGEPAVDETLNISGLRPTARALPADHAATRFQDEYGRRREAREALQACEDRLKGLQVAEAKALEGVRGGERTESTSQRLAAEAAKALSDLDDKGGAAGQKLGAALDASHAGLDAWVAVAGQAHAAAKTVDDARDALQAAAPAGALPDAVQAQMAAYGQAARTAAAAKSAPAPAGEASAAGGDRRNALLQQMAEGPARGAMGAWLDAVDQQANLLARTAREHPAAAQTPVLDLLHEGTATWVAAAVEAGEIVDGQRRIHRLAAEAARTTAEHDEARKALVVLRKSHEDAQALTSEESGKVGRARDAVEQAQRRTLRAAADHAKAAEAATSSLSAKMAEVEQVLERRRQDAQREGGSEQQLRKLNVLHHAAEGDPASVQAVRELQEAWQAEAEVRRRDLAGADERRLALREARLDPTAKVDTRAALGLYREWIAKRDGLAYAQQVSDALGRVCAEGEERMRAGAEVVVEAEPARRTTESGLAALEHREADALRDDLRRTLGQHPAGFHMDEAAPDLAPWRRLQAASADLLGALDGLPARAGAAVPERRQLELMESLAKATGGDVERAEGAIRAVLAQPADHWMRPADEVARLPEGQARLQADVVAWHAQMSARPRGLDDLLALRPAEPPVDPDHAGVYFSAARAHAAAAHPADQAWAGGAMNAASRWARDEPVASRYEEAAARGFLVGFDQMGPDSQAQRISNQVRDAVRGGKAASKAGTATAGPFAAVMAELPRMTGPQGLRDVADEDMIRVARSVKELVSSTGGLSRLGGSAEEARASNVLIARVCDDIIRRSPDAGADRPDRLRRAGRHVLQALHIKPPKDDRHPSAANAAIDWGRVLPNGAKGVPSELAQHWCAFKDGKPAAMRRVSPADALSVALDLLVREPALEGRATAAAGVQATVRFANAFKATDRASRVALVRNLVATVKERHLAAWQAQTAPARAPIGSGQDMPLRDAAQRDLPPPDSPEARRLVLAFLLEAAVRVDEAGAAGYPNAVAAMLAELPERAFQTFAGRSGADRAAAPDNAHAELLTLARERLEKQPKLPGETAEQRQARHGEALKDLDGLMAALRGMGPGAPGSSARSAAQVVREAVAAEPAAAPLSKWGKLALEIDKAGAERRRADLERGSSGSTHVEKLASQRAREAETEKGKG